MNYYTDVIKKYTQFTGRATRKEYWMFVLFNVIISFVIGFIDKLLGLDFTLGLWQTGVLSIIYSLFVLLPGTAVSVRRLHDIDKSGWNLLLSLIPLVGAIIVIVFMCKPGTAGVNKYGETPDQTIA